MDHGIDAPKELRHPVGVLEPQHVQALRGNILAMASGKIIDDGDLIVRTMRGNHISRHDVEEDMRLAAKTEDLKDIRKGYVERSGDISFIKKES